MVASDLSIEEGHQQQHQGRVSSDSISNNSNTDHDQSSTSGSSSLFGIPTVKLSSPLLPLASNKQSPTPNRRNNNNNNSNNNTSNHSSGGSWLKKLRKKQTMNRASRAAGLSLPGGSDLSFSSSTSSTPSSFHASTRKQYFSRAVSFDQMDLQAALDQMRTVLSFTPQRVYKTSYYRKQTKNHWARDDPAFAVLEIGFLVVASFAYCVAFKQSSLFLSTLKFALQHVGGFWLGGGAIVSTVGQVVANTYLTPGGGGSGGNGAASTGAGGGNGTGNAAGAGGTTSSHHVRQGVEWLYAFDIHCNAFLPLFILLYGVQFFLLPLVLGNSIAALIVSNTLYALALSWYFYITHLGYRALPFLSGTEVFLLPIVVVALIYVLNYVGYPFGLGWNASRLMAHFFFD